MSTKDYDEFDVRAGTMLLGTVQYEKGFSAKQVRRQLFDDSLGPYWRLNNLSVYKRDESRPAYVDCARATHPEEL